MNKLELLQTFVRVAERSSFTQASESLGLPRSTVSEQIRALEELMHMRLLQRTTRKVQMTPEGQMLYERSKDLLAQMDELEGLFRKDDASIGGRLRVDMPTAVMRRAVMPRLAEFIERYPGVDLELSATDRQVDLVREGFDCVLRVGELHDSALVARRIGRYRMINYVSAAYARRHGVPKTLADLPKHRLVHFLWTFGPAQAFFEYHDGDREHQVPMPRSLAVNNVEAYDAACMGGLGIIQAPLANKQPLLDSGELVEVLPQYRPAPMPVSLLYPHRRHLPERCRVFMDWLEGVMRDYGVT